MDKVTAIQKVGELVAMNQERPMKTPTVALRNSELILIPRKEVKQGDRICMLLAPYELTQGFASGKWDNIGRRIVEVFEKDAKEAGTLTPDPTEPEKKKKKTSKKKKKSKKTEPTGPTGEGGC